MADISMKKENTNELKEVARKENHEMEETVPKTIICVSGLKGAGKTTIVKRLSEEYEIPYIELGELVKARMSEERVPISKIYEYSLELRKEYGKDVVAKMAIDKMNEYYGNIIIIDGLRTEPEFNAFNSVGQVYIIVVHASPTVRYQRILARGRPADPYTLEKLIDMDKKSLAMGIEHIFTLADYRINNNGILDEALAQARAALNNISGRENERSSSVRGRKVYS